MPYHSTYMLKLVTDCYRIHVNFSYKFAEWKFREIASSLSVFNLVVTTNEITKSFHTCFQVAKISHSLLEPISHLLAIIL